MHSNIPQRGPTNFSHIEMIDGVVTGLMNWLGCLLHRDTAHRTCPGLNSLEGTLGLCFRIIMFVFRGVTFILKSMVLLIDRTLSWFESSPAIHQARVTQWYFTGLLAGGCIPSKGSFLGTSLFPCLQKWVVDVSTFWRWSPPVEFKRPLP